MRSLLVGVAAVGLFGGLGYVAGEAFGLWDPVSPPRPAPEQAVWTTYRVAGFSVDLPDTWRRVARARRPAPDLVGENPAFEKYVAQARKSSNTRNKLQAFDLSPLSRRTADSERFVTNMGVIKARVHLRAAALWQRDVRSLEGIPNRVGPVRRWRVRIDGHQALKLNTRVRLRSAQGARHVLSMTQWSVLSGGYEYVLTYVTTARAEPAYAATFEKSAASFALSSTTVPSRPEGELFRERVEEACARRIPDLPPPLTSSAHAQARARGYALLGRDLRRVDAPKASRAVYNEMISAVDDIVAAEQRMAQAARAGDAQGSYNAVGDVLDAVNPAVRLAHRLRLPECAAGFDWTA